MMNPRTVLVGIDGADFSILDPLMDQGVMPFLKQFVSSGVRSELLSVVPPLTPPAWTSLMTGRSPGQHGVFDFFIRESVQSHKIRLASSYDIGCETIWSIASRNSMRVTSLNFPLMFPPPQVEGNVVPGGWMPWRQLRLGCHPSDLFDRLASLPGFNARELGMDASHEEKAIEGCPPEELEAWVEQAIRRERRWLDILEFLAREDPSELTALMFDGVDKVQHLCWRFLDPTLVEADPLPSDRRVRDLCLAYFRQLDQLLAKITEQILPDANVIIASDHGFRAQLETFAVNTWLEQNGYLAWADETLPRQTSATEVGIARLGRHVYMLDWERTLAYAPTPSSNGIHIVRSDDEGEPGVPHGDYGRFRSELVRSLRQIMSPTTGRPVVSRVWTREEAFSGPRGELAPDLTIELWDGGMVSILASDATVKPRPLPTGTHRPEGVFLAAGPGFRRGATLPGLSILDVAPTVLYSLGLDIPGDMEGRVPTEALDPAWLQARPVRTASGAASASAARPAPVEITYTEEEERALAERLRALGYIA